MAPTENPSDQGKKGVDRRTEQIATSVDSQVAVAAGVELSKLLSMSSFGTPEARDARLKGHKEAEQYRAENSDILEADAAGGDASVEIDLAIADELDARGYTFEAEMRYRRLVTRSAIATGRLALMLEMKGYRAEAWRLYLSAANRDEPNSMWRLAVICSQRGKDIWARRLARRAYSLLGPTAQSCIAQEVDHASSTRREHSFGAGLGRSINSHAIDVLFALGSFFYVMARRPDLARLSYSSALGRGNSLAGVSLLDMKPRTATFSATSRTGFLHQLLATGINTDRYRTCDACDDPDLLALEAYSVLLKNTEQNSSAPALFAALRARGGARSGDALERLLINARLFTTFQGFRMYGTGHSYEPIQRAADEVCAGIPATISSPSVHSGADLINAIWRHAQAELGRVGEAVERKREQQVVRGSCGLRREVVVPGAGVAARLGVSFTRLTDDEARVITQRISGLFNQDVADALGTTIDTTRALTRAGVRSMREFQQGEQIPTSNQLLWEEVESSFPGRDTASDLDSPPRYHPITGPVGPVAIEGHRGEVLGQRHEDPFAQDC